MTKFFQLFLAVVPYRRVVALPLSYPSATVTATQKHTPVIVIFISLFFLVVAFFAMKLVYMKHRRIGTIHALPRPTPTFGLDKQGNRDRGLFVGCFGSPTWETSLTSGTSRRQRQRSSFAYQLHTRSTRSASAHSRSKNSSSGSHLTKSTAFASYSMHADRLVLPSSSGSSRIPPQYGGSASEPLPTHDHPRCGDFGEFHGVRSPNVPMATRRASPCSIRLVDGPSQSNQVDYMFLSALPPNGIVGSPLTGTRDSFQLSRCALKCHGKPVPPMPSLPSFLPFSLAKGPPVRAREYLPPLRFSPLASVAKVFHSSHQVFEKKASMSRIPDLDGSNNAARLESASSSETRDASNVGLGVAQETSRTTSRQSNHKKSHSYKGLTVGGSLSRIPLVEDVNKVEPVQTGRKPLKSCLRQNSVASTHTPSMSEISCLRTPITDDDIGMLGLDRFRWNDDIKEFKACHMKKDSAALVPVWE